MESNEKQLQLQIGQSTNIDDGGRRDEQHHRSFNFICVRSALLLFDLGLDPSGDLGKIAIPELDTFAGEDLGRQLQRPDGRYPCVQRIKLLWTVSSQTLANIHHQVTSGLQPQ